MNEELMDKFIDGEIIINTRTQEGYDCLMKYLSENTKIKWKGGEYPINDLKFFSDYKEKTYIKTSRGKLKYGGLSDDVVKHKIVVFEELIDKKNNFIKSKFEKILIEMLTTYRKKNDMYGDSFGKSVDKYGMIAALTRISDKFNRFEQMILNDNNGTPDERLRDTLLDMASYCVMTIVELEDE